MPTVKALDNPLEVDEQTLKEFKQSELITPERKLAFLQNQKEELEGIYWRSRVDVVHATRLTQSPVEALKLKGNSNMSEHKNQVQQFYDAIKMIDKMITQIRKAHPELAE